MRNVFILYMPPGNHEAMVHYEDTIKRKVSQDRILKYIDRSCADMLHAVFDNRPIAVWGSRDSGANRGRFERMKPGDEILIVEGDTIKLLGIVAAKTHNPALSKELWKPLRGVASEGWDLVYFIANPREINLSFKQCGALFGYRSNYQLRGFTNISEEKLTEFYETYDDLYSVLLRLKQGEQPKVKESVVNETVEPEDVYKAPVEDQEEDYDALKTDHFEMQWRLLKLGLKTGAKVWAPKNDQKRITKHFSFSEFEDTFAAGLDTQTKYVENIDVVWKEEFRIDAAFEVENSTSIYSGLLRFSDLTVVAPNSPYPLFIVAPTARRNRVLDQVRRPTFKRLPMAGRVKYLSYDAVREIDDFFEGTKSGLSVDVVTSKAEQLAVA